MFSHAPAHKRPPSARPSWYWARQVEATLACYLLLDNWCGVATAGKAIFNLAGCSRNDKAAIVDERKWQAFQRREAAKLGLVID